VHRSVATVSMSGTLRDKLEAIAAARFDGFELFENDLLYFKSSPAEVGRLASDLGLTCDLYQPFRDFEGVPDEQFQRNLERAERKFDVMQALGAPLMLVCSNTQPSVLRDEERMAAQLHALAERAARRNMRIGYEALAWGQAVNRYAQAWRIVERANHPHLGLILDSFHTLSLGDDPAGIAKIPGDRIFFVQMADAPVMGMDVLQWARHYRNFPGQGQLDVENFFEQALRAGYAGPLSLEIFNDVFRASPNRRTALDAMRSLLYLESQVRRRLERAARSDAGDPVATRVLERTELFNPPAAPEVSGLAFIEFAVDEVSGQALDKLIVGLGFARVGRHRSKAVTLYRQGGVHLILNAEPNSFARRHFDAYGVSVCTIGLLTDDAVRTAARALAMQSLRFDSPRGRDEAELSGTVAPGGLAMQFVDGDPLKLFERDFVLDAAAAGAADLHTIDHVAFHLSQERLPTWVLFCRALFGLSPGESLELADPFGLIRTASVSNPARSVRLVATVSMSEKTQTARAVSASGGVGVNHIAFHCDDIFAAVDRMRRNGVAFGSISDNYYDDLLARLDLDRGTVERMRALGVMYDQSSDGAYFHIYSEPFAGRFSFEIVHRVGGYDAYGAGNAPARMAAHVQEARAH
jgi:4-hydroxyphenylpyruvate dioxygenase